MTSDKPQSLAQSLNKAGYLIDSYRFMEALTILEPLIGAVQKANNAEAPNVYLKAGICYYEVGNLAMAKSLFSQGLATAQNSVNNLYLIQELLYELSLIASEEKNYIESLSLCKQSLKLSIELDIDIYNQLNHLAILYQYEGNITEAKRILEIAQANCRRNLDYKALSVVLNELGSVNFILQDYYSCTKCFLDSIKIKFILGNLNGVRLTVENLQRFIQIFPQMTSDPKVGKIIKEINQVLNDNSNTRRY